MKKAILILLSLIFLVSNSFAQKNYNNWIFGDGVWLYFPDDISDPSFVEKAAINQVEGCASYSDDNGNLLFYTDGMTVWNKNHIPIINGTGLNGSWTSFQGAYIFPSLNNTQKLFIISIGSTEKSTEHIYFSIIDFTKGYDKAEVINKNKLITNYNGERAAVIRKVDKPGYWLILDDVPKPNYKIFSVDDAGFTLNSEYTGSLPKKDNHGQIKVSKNGNLIVSTDSDGSQFEICRFDPFNGVIYENNMIKSAKLGTTVHGDEFSPNSQYLYLSSNKIESGKFITILNQFEIIEYFKNNNIILNTIVSEPFTWRIGSKEALQIAPNNKIYIASPETNYISSIEAPDLKYPLCNYVKEAINLSSTTCKNGLPSLLVEPIINYTFKDTIVCEGSDFEYETENGIGSFWLTPNKDVKYSSSLTKNNFSEKDTGYYHLYNENNELKEILHINLTNSNSISIISNNNVFKCEGDTVTLFVNGNTNNKLWNTGEKTDTIKVNKSGIYSVDVLNEAGCQVTDTIEILFNPRPKPNIIGQHQVIGCENVKSELLSEFDHSSYKWLDNSSLVLSYDKFVTITKSGRYKLIVSNEFGCFDTTEYYDVEFIKDTNVLSIDYSFDNYISFDTVYLDQLVCRSIKVKNLSSKAFNLKEIKLRDKYNFSAPPSQFPLEISPFQEIEFEICFSGESIGRFEDFLEIEDNCTSKSIQLEAFVSSSSIEANSKCDVPLSFVPVNLNNSYIFKTTLPYPNPATGKVSIDYYEVKPLNGNNSNISIYDSKGCFISDLEREIIEIKNNENGTLEIGKFSLNQELENGIYFIKIQHNDETKFESIIIKK